MSNEIGVIWTSDQRQLIADLQKQIIALQNVGNEVKKVGAAGRQAGTELSRSYGDAYRAMDKLRSTSSDIWKQSQSPMNAHLQRLKELRAMYRMGKIDIVQLGLASKRSADEMHRMADGSPFDGLTGKISAVTVATTAFLGTLQAVRAEYENIKRVAKEALSTNLTFARAEEQAHQSLDESMTPKELTDKILQVSKDKKIAPTVLMRQANQVLAAKDDRTTSKEAIDTLADLSEFTRLNPDESGPLVSSILGLKQALPNASNKELLGIVQQGKITSKVANTGKFAESIVPAMSAGRAYGDAPQDVSALASAIGGQMQDVQGKRTASAVIDLEKDLDILSKGVESGLLGGKKIKGGLGSNTVERIRNVAFNPEFKGLKERLLGENEDQGIEELFKKAGRMTAESRSYGAIRLLYQGDQGAHQSLNAMLAQQVSGQAAEAVADRQAKAFSATPSQVIARTDSRLAADAELAKMKNTDAAIAGMARERLPEVMRAHGATNFQQTLAGIDFEVQRATGGDSAGAMKKALQRQIDEAHETGEFYKRDSEMPAWMLASPWRSGEEAQRQAAGMSKEAFNKEAALRDVLSDLNEAIRQMNPQAQVNVNVNMPDAGKVQPGQPATGLNAP